MPDHVLHCLPERRSETSTGLSVRGANAYLTGTEREALRELRRRYELAAAHVADALTFNRLDLAHDCLQRLAAETDGLAIAVAAKLGQ